MSDAKELNDIESIRKRPGMFVGDTTNRSGTHQMAWEVLANAIDQFLAERCTRIDVTMTRTGRYPSRTTARASRWRRTRTGSLGWSAC